MIEFDVRLTSDNVPVLAHDSLLAGSKRREFAYIRRYTLDELQKRLKKRDTHIDTLDEALREVFGEIYLNIELKEVASVGPVLDVVRKYVKTPEEMESIMFSSFNPFTLRSIRQEEPSASLGLLHYRNPLAFIGWHRLLKLSAVGFHRLYINPVSLEVAKRFGLFAYVYTVNRPDAARRLEQKGIDGIVTDYPEKMTKEFSN